MGRVEEIDYDPFEVLNLSADPSSLDEKILRAAYLERSKLLHPDVNPDRDTTEQMAQINEAYDIVKEALSSPE